MLKLRIKTQPRGEESLKSTLKDFFKLYFRNLYNELNSLLSDYHSIQEHSNRGKIIEFASKKQKDLELLQVFVTGSFLNSKLNLLRFKSEDAVRNSAKIVEMAEFLAILYQNMKSSFIPSPNIELALQMQIDIFKLLPANSKPILNEIEDSDFEEIHRLMKIYILKENIKNYTIDKGILTIKSDFFDFELALCGDILNPSWHLLKVRSFLNNKKVEDQLQKRLPTIERIVSFIEFFEMKKRVSDVYNILEHRSGFYQNFTGSKNGFDVHGQLIGNIFICKISNKNLNQKFVNPKVDEIYKFLDSNSSKIIKPVTIAIEEGKEFKPLIFDANITIFRNNMFFCLCKEHNIGYFGMNSQICGLKYMKMTIKYINGSLSCFLSNTGTIHYQFGSHSNQFIDSIGEGNSLISNNVSIYHTKLKEFIHFIDHNLQFFEIIWRIRDLSFTVEIKDALYGSFFKIDKDLDLYTIESVKISSNSTNSNKIDSLLQKTRLLHIQNAFKDNLCVLESKIGEKIILSISDIKIAINNTVKTSLRFLTEDCQKFNINEALQYTINFGSFYQNNLYPDVFSVKKIVFVFLDLLDENVSITIENNLFKINGSSTLKAAKINNLFSKDDIKTFIVLYRLWIANRFMALKKELGSGSDKDDQVDLGNGKSISLTLEGLKYHSNDPLKDSEINRALNTEKFIWKYFK